MIHHCQQYAGLHLARCMLCLQVPVVAFSGLMRSAQGECKGAWLTYTNVHPHYTSTR